jgi:hypothetical protein
MTNSNQNNPAENLGNDAYEGINWDLTPEDFAGVSGESGEKNRPVHKLRFGRLNLAIWQRQQEGTHWMRYSVRVVRSYKAADGSYKDTASLDAEDLPTAASLMLLAQQWIIQRNADVAALRANKVEGDQY